MENNTDIITAEIVDAAYQLHKSLGPGLLESVYERLLAKELERRGLHVERQKAVSFEHEGLQFDGQLVIDLLDLQVGLLLNFGAPTMKDGIRRIVNGYSPTSKSRLRMHQKSSPEGQGG